MLHFPATKEKLHVLSCGYLRQYFSSRNRNPVDIAQIIVTFLDNDWKFDYFYDNLNKGPKVHGIKNNGKLPSGECIADLKKLLSGYNIRAVIGGCISPEIYQKVSTELKELNYEYGFKINAFENIPDDWSITPNANPNLSLGKRTDLDPDVFVDFCKKAISEGASFVGGCCEINHHHIQALSNEL